MPNACNLRRVLLVWPFRARALRCCARVISAEVRSSNALGTDKLNHQNGINAATAVWIWHSVNSRFLPPELLAHPRQEQVAHAAQNQVAFQSLVATALELVQANLGFLVLKTTLHAPPRERHEQQVLHRRFLGS